MKICILTPCWYEYELGGIETYLLDLLKKLKEQNIETFVLVPNYEDNKIIKNTDKNIHVYKVPFISLFSKKNLVKKGKRLYKFLTALIKKENIQIVETENLSGFPAYSLGVNLACTETSIPLIERIHSFPDNETTKVIIKQFFWDKVISVSHAVTEDIYKYGVPIRKLSTIYPGVDTKIFKKENSKKDFLKDIFKLDKDDLIILHSSRIVSTKYDCLDMKGIYTLLKSFSLIHQTYKNANLVIAAARSSQKLSKEFEKAKQKIMDLCNLYGISNKVFIRSFEFEEMPSVYNGSDIFVMASKIDALGRVYLEAMSSQLPVIGTNIGGIPEIIDNGKDGYIIDADNPVELAKKLIILIQDPKKRISFGIEARKKVIAKFSLESMFNETISAYKNLIAQ